MLLRFFPPGAAHAPESEEGEEEDGEGVADDAGADGLQVKTILAEIDDSSTYKGGEDGLGEEAREVKTGAGPAQAIDKPIAVILLTHGAHEPGVLEIARGDEHAAGTDDERRDGPKGEDDADGEIERDAPLPAHFFCNGIAFEF